ncbi:Mobile element protein [hydrothermal vent metagenome]|uniref:Mobile element protein n=1 Tax=hydrothermal vent metagenome TaxID=652676 RepID=A0A3B1BW42_9ZZZZ
MGATGWAARNAGYFLFDYDPRRGQAVPQRLLEGFHGYLQTDGYDGYNAAVINGKLTHEGCWAHARRKFSEAVKANGLESYAYLRKIFTELPRAVSVEDIEILLPWNAQTKGRL